MAGTPPLLDPDAEAAWELLVLGARERPSLSPRDADDAAWFRARLHELGFTQGTFSRFMMRRGDLRPRPNILRSLQRMSSGRARVPGEMRVLLNVMLRSRERGMARRARERDERDAPWNDPPAADGSDGRLSEPPERASNNETAGVLSGTRTDGPRGEAGAGQGARPAHSSERGEAGPASESDAGQGARSGHSSETRSGGDGPRGEAGCRPGVWPSHSSETRSGGDGPRDRTSGGPEARPGDLSEHGEAGPDDGAAEG